MPTNYVHSGFYDFIYPGSVNQSPPYGPNEFAPFQNNSYFQNFVFSPENLDTSGNLATDLGATHLPLHNFSAYKYATNGVAGAISSNLGGTNSQWIYCSNPGEIGSEPNAIGLYIDDFQNYTIGLSADTRNIYGLKILSVKIHDSDDAGFTTLYPGNSLPYAEGPYFFEVETPVLTNIDYYFCQPYAIGNTFYSGDLPGTATFDTGSTSSAFYTTLRGQTTIACWAKQRIVNGYTNKFVYAQQYFDKAYFADGSGNITTNETGVLSEYGDFYPTQAGKTFLTTKPDSYGNRGTAIVYVVGLQADVNRDGEINGMDVTTVNSPYVFWVNNDVDRGHSVDGGDFEEDDLIQNSSQIPNLERVPDYQFTGSDNVQRIPSKRDLEDYTRLWIPGIAALASELPSGYTLELAWDYPHDETRPSLNVFAAVETNGGLSYLTNDTTATQQTNISLAPFYGTVSPFTNVVLNANGHSIPSEHFIICGAARGSGPLTIILRSPNGSYNTLATINVQIKDIKEMYERWTVGDAAGGNLRTTAEKAQNDLSGFPAFEYDYDASRDTNTPYIVFVHGWNMDVFDKDRFAETAFKRLYWQGYKGRFGSFRWPTKYYKHFWDYLDFSNFDASEWLAWRSGLGLNSKLAALNGQYLGSVYLLAHSMGNVVAGEALKLAETGQIVNTYVASQAAISARSYDNSIGSNVPYSLVTPDSLGHYYTNTSPAYFDGINGAGIFVNYYNASDWALTGDSFPLQPTWLYNQRHKPDGFDGYHYESPSETHPSGYYRQLGINPYRNLLFPDDTYEIFGRCAQSYSYALGAQSGVGGAFSIQVNLNSSAYKFGQEHKGHSGQFRSNFMTRQSYWDQLLKDYDLK